MARERPMIVVDSFHFEDNYLCLNVKLETEPVKLNKGAIFSLNRLTDSLLKKPVTVIKTDLEDFKITQGPVGKIWKWYQVSIKQ